MFSKTRLVTVGMAVAVVAIMYRIPQAKTALTGETKFLGIF